ncbi:MAG: cache domain-containing protein [Proteobacteria bacterium]|nr:cache domain-containing protein [Pseudomonadota bacterium]MBU4469578.1 cache domain-containing protein [Pseudomonadota bacterium]MCG2753256.1 DUF294 nucleotidyltransferase-like domain-containing protein [Desulfobacteraceae bacterium]
MKTTTRVNLHCHSTLSDGELSPEALGERMGWAGVEYASLTDHDSIDGLSRFHEALNRNNIGFLSGVEITARYQGREIHVLGYSFDIHHRELVQTLRFLRHDRLYRTQGPLRRMPSLNLPKPDGESAPGVAETGKIEICEAIALIHRAGGKAFLAHPLIFESRPQNLALLLSDLKQLALDGVEVIWGGQGLEPDQEMLLNLADEQGLSVCAGTDFHGTVGNVPSSLGMDMPTQRWKQLVRSLHANPALISLKNDLSPPGTPSQERDPSKKRGSYWRPRILLPSLLAILLFIGAIWGIILPGVSKMLIDRKRDTIRELTHTALSLLGEAEREERSGQLSPSEAREKAKEYIGALRYGKEGKDYFWIQDMQPKMIMHPYRKDLNGQDVSGVTDPRGVRIFVEFAKIVKMEKKGFVAYVWQWKDDPDRVAAKESYVMGFEPWGWIIGTGLYTDDVLEEIRRIKENLVYTLSAIVALVFMVLLFNIRQSLMVEKKREEAQARLQEAEERYRSLIEAATEGTLLVLNGRCRYGNPTLFQMTGYTSERLELVELSDLFPGTFENEALWAQMGGLPEEDKSSKSFEGVLKRVDGIKIECVITLNPIVLAGQPGFIVLAREVIPRPMEAGSTQNLGKAAQASVVAIFQARGIGRGGVMAMNASARQLFEILCGTPKNPLALADLFDVDKDYDETMNTLHRDGSMEERRLHKMAPDGRAHVLLLSAKLEVDENTQSSTVNCILKEVTKTVRREKERESLLEKIGVSWLLTSEPMEKTQGLSVVLAEIKKAKAPDAVAQACGSVASLAGVLTEAGAKPSRLAKMVSEVCDAATIRCIELALETLGPPPASFVFMAMGSQGRQEQTLLTDQDNAIIYRREVSMDSAVVSEYFLALGSKVCEWLNDAGYMYCNGKVMANNPGWCRSLPEWKEYFSEWILKAEPKELMEFSICMDFRGVYGAFELVDELRVFLYETLKDRPSFLPHLARNALDFKPSFRLPGKIIKTIVQNEETGQLNLKEILMPIVGFARLYSLHHRLPQTHTLDRLEALAWKGAFQPSACHAVTVAYQFLMGLRFQSQVKKRQDGLDPDNCISLSRISRMEEAMLKQAFVEIESLQKKIVHDFLGGAEGAANLHG